MPRSLSVEEVTSFRERLCEVAEEQFAEHGFEGVSLRTLSDALGCSRMTPYRYFEDKAAIFAAVRTAAYERFAADQEAALDATAEPAARLRALGHAYVAFALREPHAYRLMFELAQPDPDSHPELRAAEARSWAPLRAGVETLVDAGVLEGDPAVLAHVFWAGVHGLVSLHLAGKLAHGVALEALLDPLLRQQFRGARPD